MTQPAPLFPRLLTRPAPATDQPPRDKTTLGHDLPLLLPYVDVGRLGSGSRLVCRIGSGIRVSASFPHFNLSYDLGGFVLGVFTSCLLLQGHREPLRTCNNSSWKHRMLTEDKRQPNTENGFRVSARHGSVVSILHGGSAARLYNPLFTSVDSTHDPWQCV